MPKHTTITTSHDWRCKQCFKLLGRRSGNSIHLRKSGWHHYGFTAPAWCVCSCCGTLNEVLE